MSVKLTTHQKGEVIVIVASGKLTMGESAQRPAHEDSGTGGERFPVDCSEHG